MIRTAGVMICTAVGRKLSANYTNTVAVTIVGQCPPKHREDANVVRVVCVRMRTAAMDNFVRKIGA